MTQVIKTPKDFINLRKTLATQSVGSVPTMGALHEGHLRLIERAKRENDVCVVTLFVNPTQFNNAEDLKKYPRSLDDDLKKIDAIGADYLFCPEISDMYPDNYKYKVTENSLSQILCGAHRPGHFDGVLTVVMKLLNIVRPTKVYFGEKDYQQLQLVKGMVESFFMDTEVVSVPTVGDEMGLALSSRNLRLSGDGLSKARTFAKILRSGKPLSQIKDELHQHDIEVEYLEQHMDRTFAAVHIDGVRLIDNV